MTKDTTMTNTSAAPVAAEVPELRAAAERAEAVLRLAMNRLASSRGAAHAYGDGEVWDRYENCANALAAALAAQPAADDDEWDAFVAEMRSTPEGRAALDEGRRWVQQTFYGAPAAGQPGDAAEIAYLRAELAQIARRGGEAGEMARQALESARAAAAPAQAQALSPDRLHAIAFESGMFDEQWDVTGEQCDKFGRAVERAHGIGAPTGAAPTGARHG